MTDAERQAARRKRQAEQRDTTRRLEQLEEPPRKSRPNAQYPGDAYSVKRVRRLMEGGLGAREAAWRVARELAPSTTTESHIRRLMRKAKPPPRRRPGVFLSYSRDDLVAASFAEEWRRVLVLGH
jgi:hypothetical protein